MCRGAERTYGDAPEEAVLQHATPASIAIIMPLALYLCYLLH